MANLDFINPDDFFTLYAEEIIKRVRVSLPAQVLRFDTQTQLAEIQIGLNRRKRNGVNVTPAPIVQVPVHFPGGQYLVEYQIDIGTEGIILFSHRDITSWLDSGNTQNLSTLRMLDINDAYFIPGVRSQPNVIPAFSNDGIRLRNQEGSQSIWLKNDGAVEINATSMTINSSGAIEINSTGTTVNSNVDMGSNTLTAGEATINGVNHSTHTHPYTDDGAPLNTQGPQ